MKESELQLSGERGILGIYSAGGGGHRQALLALKGRIEESFPELPFHSLDILGDTLPRFIASWLTKGWDRAKADGDVKKLKALYSGTLLGIPHHRIIDRLVFLPIFAVIALRLLRDEELTKIIDTQPLATKAIVRAARFVSAVTGRRITVTKVMTDMPTARARHFSSPARRLNPRDLACYTLMAVPPLSLFDNETEEQWVWRQERFWNQNFGLSLRGGGVHYHHFPIRKPFLELPKGSLTELKIGYNSPAEKEALLNLVEGTRLQEGWVALSVGKEELVGLIALGSQAVKRATKAYLLDLVAAAKGAAFPRRSFLFAACGSSDDEEGSLFEEICSLLREIKGSIPSHLTIVPLGFQEAALFAFLKRRADFGIFGAGGVTTMELTAVAEGNLFIHSGALPPYPSGEFPYQRHLLNGIPLWEAGNAKHLIKERGATLVTPGRRFRELVGAYWSSPNFSSARQPKKSIKTPTSR